MAEMQYTHHVGYVGSGTGQDTSTAPRTNLKKLTNFAGAVASIALIAGVGVWGYQLVMRDVSGIPVVRAAEGDMRIRPDDPGGQLAQNTGLAVNEVAAAGEAAAPADRLVLAPKPMDLTEEDMPMRAEGVAPVQQPEPLNVAASLDAPVADISEALQAGDIDAIVSQLTEGIEIIEAEEAPEQPVLAAVTVPDLPAPEPAVVQGPGPKVSIRPQLRPRSAPAVVIPIRAPAEPTTRDLDAATLPSGTRLVQLGAFDTPDIARAQWEKMTARFGEYLNGKDRVIQQAQSGGRTFYRLRAHGFEDLSDARRFCSALVAEGADCIPVVTR